MSDELTITYFYVLRLAPEDNIWNGATTRVKEASDWEIIMIMKADDEYFISSWMYDLPDSRQVWLEQITPWEYDMLDAVDIPALEDHTDLVFARIGWQPTGWEGTQEG